MLTSREPIKPSTEDTQLAAQTFENLRFVFEGHNEAVSVRVDGRAEPVQVPASAFRLFMEILDHMSHGDAVTLMPYHAELTTQEAADLLNVSRIHLVKLLDTGKTPFHKVGTHRRVRFDDIMTYKHQIDVQRMAVLDELAAVGQEMNIEPL